LKNKIKRENINYLAIAMKEPNEILQKFQSLSFQIHDNITYFFCGTQISFFYTLLNNS
jgi:hypothetical protein